MTTDIMIFFKCMPVFYWIKPFLKYAVNRTFNLLVTFTLILSYFDEVFILSINFISGCVYYGFTTTLLGITQISLLATIALDRYLVIVRPSHFTIGMSKAVTMVICCYGYGFLWALFPGINYYHTNYWTGLKFK
jgi:hypothetical protein